jgi:hypothetical protein
MRAPCGYCGTRPPWPGSRETWACRSRDTRRGHAGIVACRAGAVIQELAVGPLVGLALVLDRDGSVVAKFQQVALRLWPVDAGGSTVAVSVAPDPDLVERAARLLSLAGHWGLAQMQFLTTARGTAIIDVNARYYGSMPLATACGVNLAAAWHAVALGETPPRPATYELGVTYRWLEGDIKGILNGSRAHLRRPRPRPADRRHVGVRRSGSRLAPGTAGRVEAVRRPAGEGARLSARPEPYPTLPLRCFRGSTSGSRRARGAGGDCRGASAR